MNGLMRIENLEVEGHQPGSGGWAPIVKGVSVEVRCGEVVAFIGESGAGKSTIALAALGYVRPGCRIVGGRVMFNDVDILRLGRKERRELRGRKLAYVAQSAAAAFNSAISINDQVTEGPLVHGLMNEAEARKRAVDSYRRLQLPNPERIGQMYPHQVSGGQLQRLMAAMAMSCSPELLVFDEPTTAIDVTTQVEVLKAFKKVLKQHEMSAIYVSHDLAVVAQMADRIVVLCGGEIVEEGSTDQVLRNPREDYTKALMAAIRPPPNITAQGLKKAEGKGIDEVPVTEVKGLSAGYGRRSEAQVLHDIDVHVNSGEVLGIIGESGSGKSTLARVIAGLLPASSGELFLDGRRLPGAVQARTLDDLKRIQLVLQSPDVSFNPRRPISTALGRPLELYLGMRGAERRRRIAELLRMVELPEAYAGRYPSELSGGEKQRVNLARALAAEPAVVLCDEVTSSLDTIVGAAILDLLKHLQSTLGNAFVFISHDLSTVASLSNRITVLYAGRVVEEGPTKDVLSPPYHPYTRMLLASVPELRKGWLEDIQSVPASAGPDGEPQAGCPFYGRCPLAIEGVCDRVRPPAREPAAGHRIACHRTVSELTEASGVPHLAAVRGLGNGGEPPIPAAPTIGS